MSVVIGEKYGKLLVLEYSGITNKHKNYLCLCDCGKTKIIRGSSISNGNTKSCGCAHIDKVRELAVALSKTNGIKTRQRQYNNVLNSNNTSGVPGVSYSKYDKRWVSEIKHNGVRYAKKFKYFEDAVSYRKELEAKLGVYKNIKKGE